MLDKTDDKLTRGESLFIVAVGLFLLYLLLASSVSGQQPEDPFKGWPTHDIPGCSPQGGENSAKCKCLGMVNNVQTKLSEDCWRDNDPFGVPPKGLQLDPPFAVKKCLGEVPDHCQIIANPRRWSKIHGYQNMCRTSCKPERCSCPDSACKSHQESNTY